MDEKANTQIAQLKKAHKTRQLSHGEIAWLIERIETLEKQQNLIKSEYTSFYE